MSSIATFPVLLVALSFAIAPIAAEAAAMGDFAGRVDVGVELRREAT